MSSILKAALRAGAMGPLTGLELFGDPGALTASRAAIQRLLPG